MSHLNPAGKKIVAAVAYASRIGIDQLAFGAFHCDAPLGSIRAFASVLIPRAPLNELREGSHPATRARSERARLNRLYREALDELLQLLIGQAAAGAIQPHDFG